MHRAAALAFTLLSGCATSVAAVAGVGGTTQPSASSEGMLEAMTAGGNEDWRIALALAGGAGGRFGGAGYGLVSPSLGVDLFAKNRLTLLAGWLGRFGPEGPQHAAHFTAAWVFPLFGRGGEKSFFALGPRLRLEALARPDGTWSGAGFLSAEFRWVTFDTTGNSMSR